MLKELLKYNKELEKSANPEDKALTKLYFNYNEELIDKFIRLYLERCRFRHSLAVLQFRKTLPETDHITIK